ncbi:PBP1A family penicillin-binding protein [Pelagibacteraceae bacterium]|nr:PBP1A family penicillin-binding protein [Pelagibacteraceae bacterium]
MITKLLKAAIYSSILLAICLTVTIIYFLNLLPNYESLENYKPNVMSRVHAADGKLIREFSREYRIFIPIEDIPENVKLAFIAAEDKNFYTHYGVDLMGIFRAAINNTANIFTNKRPQGASTITQQVAKNFFFSDELALSRKIKEALLAIKIESALEKNRILELYLNQIYLGSGAYGVGAASNRYFSKNLHELSISDSAYLAALPKAPNNYHPVRNYETALKRRNWVLVRMLKNDFIKQDMYELEVQKPIDHNIKRYASKFTSDYYLEEIRRRVIDLFDEDDLYGGGLSIRTSLDTESQSIAIKSLQKGLKSYDKRHGYRGVIANYDQDNWLDYAKKNFKIPANYLFARVQSFVGKDVVVEIDNSKLKYPDNDAILSIDDYKWARKFISDYYVGPKISSPKDIFKVNDIIYISIGENNRFILEQIPKINGAIVVMDPYSGRVLALSGGFDFKLSNFNRASQAKRQPGSAFKPFVYLSALENGLKPNSLILDAPFVVDQGEKLGKWKPENYGKKFYGPTPLRKGIENSRNLMTIRIAQYLGMNKVSEIADRSGIMNNMPEVLSMSLGAGETTLLNLTSAYSSFANGGLKVEPVMIDRIQDRRGKNVYKFNFGECVLCQQPFLSEVPNPQFKSSFKQIFDSVESFQIVSMLQGAVERGTGRRTKINGLEIAGKTGTTNSNTDAWFIGFTSDIIVGVYAGFDKPSSLGKTETGSSIAVPIFKEFISNYYLEKRNIPFKIPQGIELIRTDIDTGEIKSNQINSKTIYEAYRKNDKLLTNKKTLVGKDGFKIIQIDEIGDSYEFVIY